MLEDGEAESSTRKFTKSTERRWSTRNPSSRFFPMIPRGLRRQPLSPTRCALRGTVRRAHYTSPVADRAWLPAPGAEHLQGSEVVLEVEVSAPRDVSFVVAHQRRVELLEWSACRECGFLPSSRGCERDGEEDSRLASFADARDHPRTEAHAPTPRARGWRTLG